MIQDSRMRRSTRNQTLPEPVTFEQMYLMQLIEEVRELRVAIEAAFPHLAAKPTAKRRRNGEDGDGVHV